MLNPLYDILPRADCKSAVVVPKNTCPACEPFWRPSMAGRCHDDPGPHELNQPATTPIRGVVSSNICQQPSDFVYDEVSHSKCRISELLLPNSIVDCMDGAVLSRRFSSGTPRNQIANAWPRCFPVAGIDWRRWRTNLSTAGWQCRASRRRDARRHPVGFNRHRSAGR